MHVEGNHSDSFRSTWKEKNGSSWDVLWMICGLRHRGIPWNSSAICKRETSQTNLPFSTQNYDKWKNCLYHTKYDAWNWFAPSVMSSSNNRMVESRLTRRFVRNSLGLIKKYSSLFRLSLQISSLLRGLTDLIESLIFMKRLTVMTI